MTDQELIHLRIRENSVLTTLRRIIDGDYKSVREIRNDALAACGFDFEMARVHTDRLKAPILSLLMAETLAENREPVAGILRSRGEWTFIPDGESGGASGLWLFAALDYPDRFMKQLMPVAAVGGAVCMRPLRQGWLVGVQANLLKSIIKNAKRPRDDY